MPAIAVVDDRPPQRETIRRLIEANLPEDWVCLEYSPFTDLEDYLRLLTGEDDDVAVLVLDERLHEQPDDANGHVEYSGHDVVTYLRGRVPEFPIFVITSYPDDLAEMFGAMDGVISRADFNPGAAEYVQRLVRSGQKYLGTHAAELTRLSELAAEIARGEASDGDRDEIQALQAKLGLAFGAEDFLDRSTWSDELEDTVKELEALSDEILAMEGDED